MKPRTLGLVHAVLLIAGTATVVQGFRFLDMQRIGIADESGWLIASHGLWTLVKAGNFDREAWWFDNLTVFGNLNQPLPKVVQGAVYDTGLKLWGWVRGMPVAPWEHAWDYNATDGGEWNRANAALSGGHAVLARLLSSVLTGVTAWLIYCFFAPSHRTTGLFAAWVFILHPYVLRFSGFAYFDSWYWVFLLLSTLVLVKAFSEPERWYRRMLLYGLLIGLASTSKLVGVVLGTGVVLLLGECFLRRGAWPVRWKGYALYLCAAFAIIFGANVAFWPQLRLVMQVPGELRRFLAEEDTAYVLHEAGNIVAWNRRIAIDTYPALYGVVGRPLEFGATFLRFKTLMKWQDSRSQHLRLEGEQRVFMRLLTSTWFALPFAWFGLRAAWRRKSDLHVIIGCTAVVHVVFLFATMIVSFERYYIPAIMYIIVLAGLGAVELLHPSRGSAPAPEQARA